MYPGSISDVVTADKTMRCIPCFQDGASSKVCFWPTASRSGKSKNPAVPSKTGSGGSFSTIANWIRLSVIQQGVFHSFLSVSVKLIAVLSELISIVWTRLLNLSRDAPSFPRRAARSRKLVEALSERGVVIVSGLGAGGYPGR